MEYPSHWRLLFRQLEHDGFFSSHLMWRALETVSEKAMESMQRMTNLQVKQPALLLGTLFRFFLSCFESLSGIIQKLEQSATMPNSWECPKATDCFMADPGVQREYNG